MKSNGEYDLGETRAGAHRPLIGITMGDPYGIGAEVIVKALAEPDLRSAAKFVVFGASEVLAEAAQKAGIRPFWFAVDRSDLARLDSGVVLIDHEWHVDESVRKARPTEASGRASLEYLASAIGSAKTGMIDAIVTGPINKTSWSLAGCHYPGHTELLAAEFDTKRVTMAFVAPGLRVALASAHVGLFELRNHFNIGLVFQPIDLLHDALRRWFGIESPHIAVAGLNPHAGEDGLFGDEEKRVIEPAILMARSAGIDVEGPFPPDTLFTSKLRSRYDGIVAMYHDQGLIPVKMIAFDRAVNVTLGLPFIRTSPDHGTAFDIAGKNEADPGSMREAIALAVKLATRTSSPVVPSMTLAVAPAE